MLDVIGALPEFGADQDPALKRPACSWQLAALSGSVTASLVGGPFLDPSLRRAACPLLGLMQKIDSTEQPVARQGGARSRKEQLMVGRVASRGSGVLSVRGKCSSLATLFGLACCACLDRPVSTMEPETTNLFVEQVPYERVDKIDLLFMIDNSLSMADKQVMLSQAVPKLVRRLVEPGCTNGTQVEPAGGDGSCRSGFEREFEPVRDIHVGVISSSWGGSEWRGCEPEDGPEKDDRAHLISTVRADLNDYQGLGFLAWDPGGRLTPGGATDIGAFELDLQAMVNATGEQGCGYEASLESWYRFLIDPEPPERLVADSHGHLVPEGIDGELLRQRAAFLRPDSLVAVVMLTDENDCSVAIGAQAGFLGIEGHLLRATAACAEDPTSPCCRSCGNDETEPPAGCVPLADDPVCSTNSKHDLLSDPSNLRCFDQRRRFGFDLLSPVDRYVRGLTEPLVPNRSGELVPNPLFVDAMHPERPARSPGLVFLAGIVGVPWQDVATSASLGPEPELTLLSARELAEQDRWGVLVGGEDARSLPLDPMMRESVEPRPIGEQNPVTGAAIEPPGGEMNPINGHEYVPAGAADLQYACIYPLETPNDCGPGSTCDCREGEQNPLCRDPATGAYGDRQFYAKAYPGLRQLKVLEGLEDQAIVASICPKVLDPTSLSYGYNPAVQAIIDRFADVLGGTCLPRDLTVDRELGTVPCRVVEVLPPATDASADLCAVPGRGPATGELRAAVEKRLRGTDLCDTEPYPACDEMTLCEILPAQTEGPAALSSCQQDAQPSATGYCYVDAGQGIGNPDLVAKCPQTERRLLRLVTADPDNNPLPRNGASVFYACRGSAIREVR